MLHLLDLKRNSPLPHTFLKFIAYENLEELKYPNFPVLPALLNSPLNGGFICHDETLRVTSNKQLN